MYSFQSRVRFSEVDHNSIMPVSSIVDYFQDCSTFQSEDGGIGIEHLKTINRVWLLSAWQIEIFRQPSIGENLTIGTWPYAFKSMFGYRNFIMLDEQKEPCAVANSVWVYYDTKAGRPAKVFPEDITGFVVEPAYAMHYLDRKLKYPAEMNRRDVFPVRLGNLDSNKHVNNCQYIKMAEEYLPEGFKTKRLRVDYRKSALYGDSISALTHMNHEEGKMTVSLTDDDMYPYVLLEFTQAENK